MKVVAALAILVLGGVGFLLYELHGVKPASSVAAVATDENPKPPPSQPAAADDPPSGDTVTPAKDVVPPEPKVYPPTPKVGSTMVPPPTATSPLSNPDFVKNPSLREGVTVEQAVYSAQHGATTTERRNGVGWLMSNAGPDQYPLLLELTKDPDPQVSSLANVGVNVLKSRFPRLAH
jgi:hypothetical protein